MPFPVDILWINETERKLGVKFPAGFVSSMAAANGGCVHTAIDSFHLFSFYDASEKKRIQRTCNSIDRETANARKGWRGFPTNAVAVGSNGSGDLLILLPMIGHPDTLQHAVYWWDHETAKVGKVADDFGELSRTR